MAANRKLGSLASKTASPDAIPFGRPEFRDTPALAEHLRAILDSRMVTNGPEVEALERDLAEQVGVKHCVAVSSATAGLVLALKCMALEGEVILPSFTFCATGLAVLWNNLRPVLVDIDPATCNIDPQRVEEAITPQTAAIMAVHVYGNPADEEALETIARQHGLRLIFDAAHGIGTRYRGRPVGGAGDCQVFSLSPTKTATGCEGGLITTDDDRLAADLRLARNYGQDGDYVCHVAGLNARLSEVHAAIARHTLAHVEESVLRRNELADRYMARLHGLPGLSFPLVHPTDRHSYKDFTVIVEGRQFGVGRDELRTALDAGGIGTRIYFAPPLHQQGGLGFDPANDGRPLPHTDRLASQVLCLPMYSEMTFDEVDRVVEAIISVQSVRVGSARAAGQGAVAV